MTWQILSTMICKSVAVLLHSICRVDAGTLEESSEESHRATRWSRSSFLFLSHGMCALPHFAHTSADRGAGGLHFSPSQFNSAHDAISLSSRRGSRPSYQHLSLHDVITFNIQQSVQNTALATQLRSILNKSVRKGQMGRVRRPGFQMLVDASAFAAATSQCIVISFCSHLA